MKPTLIIDPGHGGKDPGGGSTERWAEKDFVLQISLYQYDRFKQLGVPVALTRDKDVYLSPADRTKIVRDSGAKYCISNHINAAGSSTARGVETIHSIYSDGKLATAIYNAIRDAGMPGRRVFCKSLDNNPQVDYYFMHRETGVVSTVIVEYGFATNSADVDLLERNWKEYAEAAVRAFCQHAGYTYKPPVSPNGWREEFDRARKWVVEQGITDGSRPQDPVTREEVWVMLYRALGR
mgnify:CR=1 FL=1